MSGKTYLITGANRGIGRGLLNHYIAQPNNTIIAAVRNVEGAQDLHNVSKGENTRIILTKIDSSSKTDPFDAVSYIQAQGINHIDVVISAAGIQKLGTLEDLPIEDFEEVLMVNSISVLLLYKATLPLLREAGKDGKGAKFVFISGKGGSINQMETMSQYPIGSHAASKAMGNVLVRKMGMENGWLTTLCVDPGLVATDMGNMGAKAFDIEHLLLTLEESSRNTANIIDNATKEEHSEKFFNQTIDQLHPW